ncbi:PREDICTED: zinc finger protein 550-like [Miniopterus natalensis]|uniref:zinc finger protein 550-like n=1 Tax=Miniopterus natalensis TaxID=291302 RepID=UPI0007A71301|nr:PREDICTED: zinc finger protein 550-like [Miniopterus natalensis]
MAARAPAHSAGSLSPQALTQLKAGREDESPSAWALESFKDVALTFTREEWGHLDLDQKTLYQEVMPETCGLLVSLGHLVPKLELVCLLEHEQELWAVKRHLSKSTYTGRWARVWQVRVIAASRESCLKFRAQQFSFMTSLRSS